jgi:hypothetical protein
MPFREKATKACARDTAGHFLRSGLSMKVAELRGFSAILGRILPEFSATQTVWRSAQSAANPSLPEFPANREKYREFADSRPSKPDFISLNCSFCGTTSLQGVIRNREFTRHIREFISPIREVWRPGLQTKWRDAKIQRIEKSDTRICRGSDVHRCRSPSDARGTGKSEPARVRVLGDGP